MTAVQHTVLYEDAMDLDFLEELHNIPGAERIKDCIQCGTCSGSCPVSWAMEETPRRIFAMVRAGMRKEVLNSLTIWTCASCYQCGQRCPQNIHITDVMYMLKRLAIRQNGRRNKNVRALSETFVDIVNKYGRNHEVLLLCRFFLATKPLAALAAAPIGLRLYSHGRLPLGGGRVRDVAGLRRIVAKALELGGE